MDVLILNTAVLDLRGEEFEFVDSLVGAGGVAKCSNDEMPSYSEKEFKRWIDNGAATAGGPGNTAPLIARTGLKVAVGAMLGSGSFGGFDIRGRTFHDILSSNGVDMSSTFAHPHLPTGATFIYDSPDSKRGGIAYFANANDAFDFDRFKEEALRHAPKIVYYMYSGLSEGGDANNGEDLAEFVAWCRAHGSITIVDSHTLCADPEAIVATGEPIDAYRLLIPILEHVDIFFTNASEARMIGNTIDASGNWSSGSDDEVIPEFLQYLCRRFASRNEQHRLFGVTVSRGAYARRVNRGCGYSTRFYESPFTEGGVVDLVGAGDSFRAGLIAYVARNADAFREGAIDVGRAVQMGNLVASLYIKAPLDNRYGRIASYEELLSKVSE